MLRICLRKIWLINDGRPFMQPSHPCLKFIRVRKYLDDHRVPRSVIWPINLTVRRGEIVGLAGAEGNGQGEFFKCLSGQIPQKGLVMCDGKELTLVSPLDAVRAGILLLAGNRKYESLFPVLGVRNNATIQVLNKFTIRLGESKP